MSLIKTLRILKYIQRTAVFLFLAGFVILFVQKDRIVKSLSDATALANSQDPESPGSLVYYERFNLEDSGSLLMGTLLEFGAENCLACRRMQAVIDDMHLKCGNRISIQIINVTQRAGMESGKQFGVLMIPMQVLIDRHGYVVYKHTGYISAGDLFDHIEDKLLGN